MSSCCTSGGGGGGGAIDLLRVLRITQEDLGRSRCTPGVWTMLVRLRSVSSPPIGERELKRGSERSVMSISARLIRVEGRAKSMMLMEGSFRMSDGSSQKLFSGLDNSITELSRIAVDFVGRGRKLTRGGGGGGGGISTDFTVFALLGAFFFDFLTIFKLLQKSQFHSIFPSIHTKL